MAKYTFLTNEDREDLENKIDDAAENGTVSDDQIADAVEDYLEENPIEVDLSNHYTKDETLDLINAALSSRVDNSNADDDVAALVGGDV